MPDLSVSLNQSRYSFFGLLGAALVTVMLWQIPAGDYILYPFTISATWFHEIGHGLSALLLGGDFKQLLIYPSGSGIASHSGHLLWGRVGRALVALGGPLGPAIAGAFFIRAGKRTNTARFSLFFLSLALMISIIFWIRTGFGIMMILGVSLTIGFIALFANAYWQRFSIQFLGVQACISSYHQIDYLFMESVVIDGRTLLSDTGQIAKYLGGGHWFWALLIIVFSSWLLLNSLRHSTRP